ncbi:FecR domain-containing protein [uncultured Kriegella sp.]|uniref:FecR family protein n=1 Tax=uncultured Kriegella sp. TaxID=1798910 RepID=UPI0030DCBC93|tara:strand:- start:13404 stop:14531 length:1128 start_codon:yes stop_codon:yes gene_type:complete
MREQEFRKLLDKYLNGSISEEEKRILDKFSENMISINDRPHFIDESNKIEIKESLWDDIKTKSILNKKRPGIWRLAAASAAIFIGIMILGYHYIYNASTTSLDIIPENAIILELEDGRLEIIEENGSVQVTDKTGAVLGQQKGNRLEYSKTGNAEELVFNTLTIPFGKKFELKLSDGSKAFLNSGSSIKYPVKFLEGQERSVFISGEAYLNVAKDSAHPFVVNAGKLNVRVLGTAFNVSAYPEDETTEVVLVEGSVSLSSELENEGNPNVVLLEPGFKGSLDKNDMAITKNQVITAMYTSWMDGKLIFRDMTFENIVKRLERHYNISIINKNKALSAKKFNANFGDEPIEKVLAELKSNYGIRFEIIDDSQVIIE